MTTFDKALAAFTAKLTSNYTEVFGNADGTFRSGKTLRHEAMPGRVYRRIARIETAEDGEVIAHSAVAFIKIEDGSIWKAASWKGPAKNYSRGSIYHLENQVNWAY